MQLYDASGKKLETPVPNPLTGTFCRSVYYQVATKVDMVNTNGSAGFTVKNELVRAQYPHLVTLLVYESKFQLQATRREYFVYAPMDLSSSAKLAVRLWRRWEKARRGPDDLILDMNEDFPKVDDGVVSEPIDDNFFAEMWRHARQRKHKFAGDPNDPFAFTCLDQDVMVYKTSDFQTGLQVTL